ncbi:NrsF family protein [Qipengyuania sp. ASV99]|uniref:NrsF family protein n=1 Tax=Qipengyuania sp. ASV99 TaxID=3399681 RepID=UPI003A4C6AE5
MNTPTSNPGNRDDLIAALTDDLTPVARIKPAHGVLLIGFATLVAAAVSIAGFEFWAGIVTGEASAFFWITNGLLLVLGMASTAALVAGALPRVGARANAPAWSAAMLGVVPAAAIITLFSPETLHGHGGLSDPAMWHWPCAAKALAASLLVAVAAVMFLRRGAPVSMERSGWLTGLAAGSLGSLAYGLTCPLDGITHVGIMHVIPVAVAAVAGRFVVPPMIRW